jgi:hypothetical protein
LAKLPERERERICGALSVEVGEYETTSAVDVAIATPNLCALVMPPRGNPSRLKTESTT